MNRRRGATEEPVPDYLDTARDQDPRNEETRLSADACRRSAETGRSNTHQQEGAEMTIAPNPTRIQPPEGFQPEFDLEPQDDGTTRRATDKAPLFWMGPALVIPGVDLYSEWTPEHGTRVFTPDGEALCASDLLRATAALLRFHDVIARAEKEGQR